MLERALAPRLAESLERAIARGALPAGLTLPPLAFELPRDGRHGDLASPVAFALARAAHQAPLAIARALLEDGLAPGGPLAKATLALPGYINLHVSDDWLARVPARVLDGDAWASPLARDRVVVQVLWGPNEPAAGLALLRRSSAALALAAVLRATGHAVTTQLLDARQAPAEGADDGPVPGWFAPYGLAFDILAPLAARWPSPGERPRPPGHVPEGARLPANAGAGPEAWAPALATALATFGVQAGAQRLVSWVGGDFPADDPSWLACQRLAAPERGWQVMPCGAVTSAPPSAPAAWEADFAALGPGTVRFCSLLQPAHQPLTYDPAALAREAIDNPVFYVRCAIARLEGVLRLARQRIADEGEPGGSSAPGPLAAEERALLLLLARYADALDATGGLAHPHRLARQTLGLAEAAQRFFAACPMFDESATERFMARYELVSATASVLRHGFGLATGVTLAPYLDVENPI